MDASMWVAKTGLDAQQTRMNVISNNLANVNTTGFKRDRAVFEDMLYQNVKQSGGQTDANSQAPTGLMLGTGVRIVATEKLHTQGNMITTQNSLDLAISGDGYFQIAKGDGSLAYTRDGGFKISATGQLVTSSGYVVQPGISIPDGAQSVSIGNDGVVSVQLAGQAAPNQVGSLQLVDFINTGGLQPRGENMLVESAASGPPQSGTPGQNGLGLLQQGSLEATNVHVVEELVSMIETQRAYEMNSKAISTTDQMLEYLTSRL